MAEIDVGIVAKWLPRFFCLLSYIFNILLIFLVITQNRCKIGPYRQFLVCFALFDMIYSAVDTFVGMAAHHYESTFTVFVSHGPLVDKPEAGRIGLIIRCSFICLSYGIFEVHFIYRYIALCRPKLIHWFTRPLFILGWICFCLSFGLYWSICSYLIYLDDEDREFLRETFRVSFNANIDDIGILGIRYKATQPTTILRTCVALGMANVVSISVIVSYCVMGYKINEYLKVTTISSSAKRVHRQLYLALIAQTAIPFVVSFLPCIFLWYTPLFGVTLGSFNNYYTIPMLSAFPFCDPIAIIVIFSEYRTYILNILGVKTAVKIVHYSTTSESMEFSRESRSRINTFKQVFLNIIGQNQFVS